MVFFFEFLPLQQTDTNRFLLQLQCMPRFIVIAARRIDEQTVFRTDKIIIVYALKILQSHGTGIACSSHVQTELLFYNAHFMDFINRYSDAFFPFFYMDAYIDVIQAAFRRHRRRNLISLDLGRKVKAENCWVRSMAKLSSEGHGMIMASGFSL